MFFGRPYWNLGEARGAVLKLPGFVERNFDLDLGITPEYEGPGEDDADQACARCCRPSPCSPRLHLAYRRRRRRNARFLARFDAWVRPFDLTAAALCALPPERFRSEYARAASNRSTSRPRPRYFETIYNTSNAKLDFKVAFDTAARRAAPQRRSSTTPALVGGLRTSHTCARWRTSTHARRAGRDGAALDDATVAAFAARWPHRSRKELELRTPRWPEDLDFVRALHGAGAGEPGARRTIPLRGRRPQHGGVAERERALRCAACAARWPAPPSAQRLRRLRAFTWEREEMRDRSSRVYALVRRWTRRGGAAARRGGRARVDPGTSSCCGARRCCPALDGAARRRGARAARRAGLSDRSAPSATSRTPTRLARATGSRRARPPPNGAMLHGSACSPGLVRGPARVVRRIEDAGRVRPGDVLVAPFTDPGWTPLFPRLAAVVTETGGLLSHAAVIARECGIPAVLAVPNATRTIHDGDVVEVDGHRGTVQLE